MKKIRKNMMMLNQEKFNQKEDQPRKFKCKKQLMKKVRLFHKTVTNQTLIQQIEIVKAQLFIRNL